MIFGSSSLEIAEGFSLAQKGRELFFRVFLVPFCNSIVDSNKTLKFLLFFCLFKIYGSALYFLFLHDSLFFSTCLLPF